VTGGIKEAFVLLASLASVSTVFLSLLIRKKPREKYDRVSDQLSLAAPLKDIRTPPISPQDFQFLRVSNTMNLNGRVKM
jgi:hypothetical protein